MMNRMMMMMMMMRRRRRRRRRRMEEEGEQKGQRPLGCLLGISWDISWAPLGCLLGWRSRGAPGRLGCLWGPFGILLGASWGPLGSILGPLGASWGSLGGLLGPSLEPGSRPLVGRWSYFVLPASAFICAQGHGGAPAASPPDQNKRNKECNSNS